MSKSLGTMFFLTGLLLAVIGGGIWVLADPMLLPGNLDPAFGPVWLNPRWVFGPALGMATFLVGLGIILSTGGTRSR